MKTIYLIPVAAVLMYACSNSKSISEIVEKTELPIAQNEDLIKPDAISQGEKVINYDSTLTVTLDSNLISVWPIVTPFPYPYPGDIITPWPIDIGGWWQGVTLSYIWIYPDTLEDYKELPIQHISSNKNCYSFETNKNGLAFHMEVVEAEQLSCAVKQFGDCHSHLPLNVSWINTPMFMAEGNKTIQFNYPKYYELELLFKMKSTFNQQEIVILS